MMPLKKNKTWKSEYGVKSCFDKLWGADTSNDAFDNGLTNDHFVLASKSNKDCNVFINLPWGSKSKAIELHEIE